MSGDLDTVKPLPEMEIVDSADPSLHEIVARLLSPRWYMAQLDAKARTDLAGASQDAVADHYLQTHASIDLPAFSTDFYRARYAGQIATAHPLVHYVTKGAAAGFSPHPLLKGGAPLTVDDQVDAWASDMFDADAYLERYRDVRGPGIGALHHYLEFGALEGRTPHALFDVTYYLGQLSRKVSLLNAFTDYIARGWKSHVPSPNFDIDRLFDAFPGWLKGDNSPLERIPKDRIKMFLTSDARRWWSIDPSLVRPVFDPNYYRDQLKVSGITASDIDDEEALAHFAGIGHRLGLKPFALFDADLYLGVYPDIAALNFDPLDHWIRFGRAEGRSPHPFITTEGILAPDFDPRNVKSRYYHPAFDVDHYVEQACIDPDQECPLIHFVTKGSLSGLSPNGHFDTAYYLSQFAEDEAPRAPFEHFLAIGAQDGKQPMPLFYPLHYAASSGSPVENALNGFVSSRKRASPHPLVDLAYYAREARIPVHFSDLAVFDRLKNEAGEALNAFHPLFDIEYYESQRPRGQWVAAHPLTDYLEAGWKEGVSPHPLFDPDHYVRTVEITDDEAPFLHFMKGPSAQGAEPNYLLRETSDNAPHNVMERWLSGGIASYDASHGLFDRGYYQSQLSEAKIQLGEKEDPLTHYLREGYRLDLSPNRLFMPSFYREKAGLPEHIDAFRHYCKNGFRKFAPHCGVNLNYYEEQAGTFDRRKETFIEYFLRSPGPRPSTHPFFDKDFYLEYHGDLRGSGLCPVTHFLEYGIYEGRVPNGIFSDQYAVERPDLGHPRIKNGTMRQFLLMADKPVRLIFVSHDSSRTGAPAIILRLMEDFAKFTNVECLCILTRGGDRTPEFHLAGHTAILNKGSWEVGFRGELARPQIEKFMSLLVDNPPVTAFVNSAESRYVGHLLKDMGVPVISLVHELADFYEPAEFDWIYRFSDRVVYPSNFVEARAKAAVTLPPGKTVVRGQGLLRDGFGLKDRDRARQAVLKEFSLPQDTVLVVGCGTVDQRKGVDYFVNIAKLSLRAAAGDGLLPLAFLWIGEGSRSSVSPFYMAQIEIKADGLEQSIRFIGGRDDVESYFVAADIFLMTSRGDPFPCVIHEAMAAGLPCIAFEGGGGAPELIADSGIIIPLGDIEGAVNGVMALRGDVQMRERLSARAKDIIRDTGLSYDYFRFFINEVEKLTGIRPKEMGEWRGIKPGQNPPIFFLQADWSISGVNTFTKDLIDYLNKKGYPAELLFTGGMDHMIHVKEDLPEGLPARFLKPQNHTQEAIWARLQAFILSVGPCVIFPGFDYRGSAVTSLLAERAGVIGIAHSDHIEHYEHVYRLGRYWNKIVGVSRQIGEGIKDVNSMLTDRLSIIPYGVEWKGDDFDRLSAIKQNDDDILHLVYAGRFVVEQKNIYEYLKLADELYKRDILFRMHLCGDGPEYQSFAAKAASHGAMDRIMLPGRMDSMQMDEIFSRAHVVLLLSDYEGLPLAMLEGMAHGCIPVCYRIDSGIGDVIESGDNGFIVPPRDVKAAADVIETLWKYPAKRAGMSAAAFQTVKSAGLRTEDMGEKYSALIDEVYEDIRNLTFNRPRSLTAETPLQGIIPSPLMHM